MCLLGFCFGGWWLIPIVMMIFCMVVCFLPFRRLGSRSCWGYFDKHVSQKDSETSMELLKKRYVKGEIASEEFEKIKRDIQN